jgi:hypothetical protein
MSVFCTELPKRKQQTFSNASNSLTPTILAAIPNNIVLRDCVANGNGKSSDLTGYAAGIHINILGFHRDENQIRNIIIDNCITIGNGVKSAELPGGVTVQRGTDDRFITF